MPPLSNIIRISGIDLNVPPKEVKSELQNLFSKNFKFFNVDVVKPKTRNTRLAFVKFKNVKDADEAVKMYDKLQLFGKNVRVAIDRSEFKQKNKGEYSTLINEVHTLISKLTDDGHDHDDQYISNSYKGGKPPSQTLYIGRLDETITKQDLQDIFEKFGVVESVSLHVGDKKIFAFVRYFNLFMAKKALKNMKGKKILGLPVTYGYAATAVSKYLWLGGIGPWVDPILLRKKLEEFGEIERLEWPTNKNFAYIQFSNPANATKAIEKLRGSRLGKRKLYLDYTDHDQMTSHLNYSDLYLGGDSYSESEEDDFYKEYESHKYKTPTRYDIPPRVEEHLEEDAYYKHHDDYYRRRSRSLSPERRGFLKEPFIDYESRKPKDYNDILPIDYIDRSYRDTDYRHPRDLDDRLPRDIDDRYIPHYNERMPYIVESIPYEEKYKYEEHLERRPKRGSLYNSIDDAYVEKNDVGLKCTIKNDLYYSSVRNEEMDPARSSRKRKDEIMIVDVPPMPKKHRSRSKDDTKYGVSSQYHHRVGVQDRIDYPVERDTAPHYPKDNYTDYKMVKRDYDYNDGEHVAGTSRSYNSEKRFPEERKISPAIKKSQNLPTFKNDITPKLVNSKMDQTTNTRIKYIIPRGSPAFSKSSQNLNKSMSKTANSMATSSAKVENIYPSLGKNVKNISQSGVKNKSYLDSKYPLIWQGAITLKTNCYWTDVCFISGAINLVHKLMNNPSKTTDEKILKITQRLRLDMPHTMEELERRINSVGRSGSCVLIASVPSKLNIDPDSTPYSELPLSKLSTFLKETQFAAVVSLTCEDGHTKGRHRYENDQSRCEKGLLHIFPVCSISLKFLQEEAPDLVEEFKNRDELLMVLIKDTENN